MALTIELPLELEQLLVQKASQQGLSLEAFALQLLSAPLPSSQQQIQAVNLLQSWIDEDDTDQQETGKFLIQALDAERPDRQLFPDEMKGITW